MDNEEISESEETIVADVESATSMLRVKIGGKMPMAEMSCRVTVSIDKIDRLPEMVTKVIDELYNKAQEKNLLPMG